MLCASHDVATPSEHQPARGDDRVFVKDGFRSYRRTYRLAEVYWGLGVFAGLLALVAWVGWKGAHPDPALFDVSAAVSGEPAAESPSSAPGPLPAGLGDGAFRPGKVGEFSSENLYVKINGRAGFFQSFGVKSLHAVTLESGPAGEGAGSVDIELYDLGEAQNAIGAYNGERPPEVEASVESGSSFHVDRNAAFLARGRYYVRVLGSDESPAVLAEVRRLLDLFKRELPAAELPWAFALFVDQLKLSPSAVSYVKNNAFSFGFARDVFKAQLSAADSTEDAEAFVTVTGDPAAADALAAQYQEAFESQGPAAGKTQAGVPLFKDEFLGTLSGATAVERWVVGMRGAPSASDIDQMLSRLAGAIAALPPDVRARALPAEEPDEADPATPTETPEEGNDEY